MKIIDKKSDNILWFTQIPRGALQSEGVNRIKNKETIK